MGDRRQHSGIQGGRMKAYCVVCGKEREMEEPKIVVIETRMAEGHCPECGSKMTKALGRIRKTKE